MHLLVSDIIFVGVLLGFARESATCHVERRIQTDEEKLLALLFRDSGYNPSARPVLNSSKTVEVSVQLSLLQIQELNLKSQVFTTTGLLILEWFDERLQWDVDEFHMKDIVVEARKLWRPEFASIKGAEDIYKEFGQFRAIIEHDGKVHWEPGGVFKTICEIDITYYPFDEQCCTIMFGSWSYHTLKMNLTSVEDIVNLDSFEKNGEWEIFKTRAVRSEMNTSTSREKLSCIEFQIFIRRRYTFYILNVILPSLMTSVILLSVFFSTPAQKVQIGVVVLLSFRILLLNVTDSIPKTSEHIPLLGVYLTLTMGITTLSMVLTVYVLNLYAVSDRPVPQWADKLVSVYLARLVGMHKKKFLHEPSQTSDEDEFLGQEDRGVSFGSSSMTSGNCKSTDHKQDNVRLNSAELIKLRETLWSREWKRVAEIVDRLFFWVFLTAVAATTLYLLHPMARSGTSRPKRIH